MELIFCYSNTWLKGFVTTWWQHTQISMYLNVEKAGLEPATQKLCSSVRCISETHITLEEYI